jgi:hypothetical protein
MKTFLCLFLFLILNSCNGVLLSPEKHVRDPRKYKKTFAGYDCNSDCSGHEAGYTWAEENEITDLAECEDSNSDSFIEGCEAYLEENDLY